ncbi:hypothetical protein BJX96DRAFT_188066 [Aspergillus floccosus]
MSELARTLPASWYRSLPLYQLERRAVFLRSWYLLGPVTRFQDIGEKVEYEIAQQSILAYRSSGNSGFPGPDEIGVICAKTEKSLPHHVTPTGLVFAALSDDAPTFHEYFPDLEPLLQRVDFTKRPYKRSIKYEGRFNWKTMVDGYQECLHCQYTHPSFSVYYPPTFYEVHNHQNFSQHIADPKKPDDGLFLYFFPNCTLNVYGGGMSSFRVCPTEDPNVTRMEFDYYHVESGEKFEEYYKFVRQVAMEDYELCEKAQDNLTKGVYSEGILNPSKENGVSYYQDRVFELVCEQHAADTRLEMETLSSFVPTPVLVVIITGLFFFYRLQPHLFIPGDKKLYYPERTGTCQIPQPATPQGVSKESDFPETWWVGHDIFELERRAIFSKNWLYLSHRSRFTKVGDYQTFNIAGFPIFLILGRDGNIRAFHNVCRHRAYTITKKESGSSPVLGCRYHGWSYNTYGQLIKAPHFDNVPGFDKSQNSLFAIHTFTDATGFIFFNLDASPAVPPADTEDLSFFVRNNAMKGAKWVGGKSVEGNFNWKMGLQSMKLFDITPLEHDLARDSSPRFAYNLLEKFRRPPQSVQLFPMSSLHAIKASGAWYALSFVPLSAQRTSVRYDLYIRGNDGLQPDIDTEKVNSLLVRFIQALEEYQESLSLPCLLVLMSNIGI